MLTITARRVAFAATASVVALLLVSGIQAANAASTISGSTTGPLVVSATVPISFTPGSPNESSPYLGVASRDGSKVYFSNGLSTSLSVIDAATKTETGKIHIPSSANPNGMVTSPDGAFLYGSLNGQAKLLKVTLADNSTTLFNVASGSGSTTVAVSPDGTRLYVGETDGIIEVLDSSTGALITSINQTAGWYLGRIVVNATGTRLYVTTFNGNHSVEVIDTATYATVASITGVGGTPLGEVLSPDGSRLYVTSQADSKVYTINTTTNTVLPTIYNVGSFPDDVAISPDGQHLYVTARYDDTLTDIELSTSAQTILPTGDEPEGVVVSPDGNTVYVGNQAENFVSTFTATRLQFTASAAVAPGTASTTVAVTLTDGITPPSGAFTGGTVLVELLDSSNTVVAQSVGTNHPTAANTVSVSIPTATLAVGTYSVRVTFTPDVGDPMVASANGFAIAAVLASTGSDSTPAMILALGLTGIGSALLIIMRVRRRPLSGRSAVRP